MDDLQAKRRDFANALVPEYWIVDPVYSRIDVLRLEDGNYKQAGHYVRGQKAESVLLKGFEVDVTEALASAGMKR